MKPVPAFPQLKYKQVEAELRQLARTLPVGSKLPSERDLAISYDCNFLTVRKALKHLVEDGMVIRRIGSGTFVADHASDIPAIRRRGSQVGILLFQQGNAYAYRVLQAIAHASLEQGVELRSSWVKDFGGAALEQALALKKDGCTALVLPWFPHERVDEIRAFVQRCPLPVSLAMVIPGLEKNCFEQEHLFGTNLIAASEVLGRYFQALGRRRLAFLGPDSPSDVILQKKLSSYACYASREDMPNLCGLIGPGAAAVDRLVERWKEHRGDLAIISYDDEHALRLMTAMHKVGLGAPDDYAIIGFNDTEASRFSDPPLSTFRQNFEHIGHWMLKNALALAQGSSCQASIATLPQLLVRATCGGAGRIDAALRAQVPELDIVVEDKPVEVSGLAA